MAKIDRIDNILRKLKKNSLQIIDKIDFKKDDLLIVCEGFEDRATEILRNRISSKSEKFPVLIIKYLPLIKENKTQEIQEFSGKAGDPSGVHWEVYDREDPAGIGERLFSMINEKTGTVYIDISAMSRLLIVQLLVAIGKNLSLLNNTKILYAEALQYPPDKENVEKVLGEEEKYLMQPEIFLSSGVFDVAVVPELSSIAMQGQPIRLVIFPSFNTYQLTALNAAIQPSYYTLIHGKTPLEENEWRLDAIKKLNKTECLRGAEDLEASTLDYRETIELLCDIYNHYGDVQKIVIAPTGSKMNAVAVGIFRIFMNDIQVVYPTPKEFAAPKEYTVGVRNVFSLDLNVFSGDFLDNNREGGKSIIAEKDNG
jgi:hypothetical protein